MNKTELFKLSASLNQWPHALNYFSWSLSFREKVTPAVFQVWITLRRPNKWGSFYLPFGVYSFDTTGLWQKVNSVILLFLIPMPLCTLCFLNFSSFDMSPSAGLSYWILIQDPLSHSVLLCEWYISCFNSRTERILWPLGALCFEIMPFGIWL